MVWLNVWEVISSFSKMDANVTLYDFTYIGIRLIGAEGRISNVQRTF